MREPIHVDPAGRPVPIARRVLHELCAHALEAQPEECCGLVTGAADERFRSVHRCRNVMTRNHQEDPETFPQDGRKAFYMSEVDYLRVREEARARGEQVTAVYHSHVGSPAYLSGLDQEYAAHALFPFPDAAQIVIAVWDRKIAGAAIFEREGDAAYRGRGLEAAGE